MERNAVMKFLATIYAKAGVLLAILVHWILDDIIIILPTAVVDVLSKMIFKWTANEYRFTEFKTFWNKQKPAEK